MVRIASVIAMVALVAQAGSQQQPPPSSSQKIRVSTESVPVYVTVTDTDKRLVPDLVLDDFEVLDNLKPQVINV